MLAGKARMDMIMQAKEKIQIAYYSVNNGFIADAFWGTIIEAADRGVQVQILLDGIFNTMGSAYKDTVYGLTLHPNIDLQLYEPFHFLKPWTWNNRLHDKLVLVDNEFAIIGGRNIGDKYFIQEETAVKDRDVLIINSNPIDSQSSVISSMHTYFVELWDHEFSVTPVNKLSNRQKQKGENQTLRLLENLSELTNKYSNTFNRPLNWVQMSIPTKKISFIHNPIQRWNKEPWVWTEITNLMEKAEDSITIESPYVIPTKQMLSYIEEFSVPSENVSIMTNSIASTPNPLAFSGHIRQIDKITGNEFDLQEYKGSDSIHGKTFVFDNRISMIGSFNLDARSTFLSTESMVVIDSTEFASHLNHEMESRFLKELDPEEIITNVEESSGPFVKTWLLKLLSYLTAPFQHMLHIHLLN